MRQSLFVKTSLFVITQFLGDNCKNIRKFLSVNAKNIMDSFKFNPNKMY